jgi:hypothetical protein
MNPLDLNIEDLEDEIQIITTSSSKVNNIFYPNINNIKNRFNDGITKNNLYKEFNSPYLICLNDDVIYQHFFHEELITQEELNHIKKSIRIIPIKYNSISESMYNYLLILSAPLFNSFNIKDIYGNHINANSDILACCLFRFRYVDINRYLKQFNGISDFIDIYNGLLINQYLGVYNNKSIIK